MDTDELQKLRDVSTKYISDVEKYCNRENENCYFVVFIESVIGLQKVEFCSFMHEDSKN